MRIGLEVEREVIQALEMQVVRLKDIDERLVVPECHYIDWENVELVDVGCSDEGEYW